MDTHVHCVLHRIFRILGGAGVFFAGNGTGQLGGKKQIADAAFQAGAADQGRGRFVFGLFRLGDVGLEVDGHVIDADEGNRHDGEQGHRDLDALIALFCGETDVVHVAVFVESHGLDEVHRGHGCGTLGFNGGGERATDQRTEGNGGKGFVGVWHGAFPSLWKVWNPRLSRIVSRAQTLDEQDMTSINLASEFEQELNRF